MSNYLLQLKKQRTAIFSALLRYNESSQLYAIELRDYPIPMADGQLTWVWSVIVPKLRNGVDVELAAQPGFTWTVTEVADDLSFEAAWNLFDMKMGSKKRASALWAKMPDETRAVALKKIREYNYYVLNTATKKAHLDTWLGGERWESEYR